VTGAMRGSDGLEVRAGEVAGRRPPSWGAIAVLATAYLAYAVNGVVNSELGPALPRLSEAFHVRTSAVGLLFTAQFAGYLVGALLGGVTADRWGYRRIMAPAALMTAIGTAGLAFVGAWPAALALTAAAGFGFGVTDSLCNAVVAAAAPREGSAALNLLHTFFGVGALAGPLIVAATVDGPGGWQVAFVIGGALALALTIALIVAPIPLPAHLAGQEPTNPQATGLAGPAPLRSPWLWAFVTLLFLFVGVEQLTGGWATTYLHTVIKAPLDVAARGAAFYWGAVTVGRLLASAAALRLSNNWLLGGSVVLACLSMIGLTVSNSVWPALVALSAVGFFFAPIYPTIVAIIARAYPRRFATLAGLLVAGGGLGGAVFPLVGGALGQGARATLWVGVAILAAMIVVFLASRRLDPLSRREEQAG